MHSPAVALAFACSGLLASSGLAVGCSGDESAGSAADAAAPADDGPLDPPPPPGGQQLTTLEYTLQPGEEKFFCYTFASPDHEVAVTEVQPISGQVVHHVLLVTMTQPRPEAFYECDVLLETSWRPIWAGGVGSNGLELPSGVGFKIPASSQYMIQFHLQNTADNAVTERSAVNLRYADDPAQLQAAGFYPLGSFLTEIPAATSDHTQTIGCAAPRDMNVFAAFPHMHKIGTRLHVESGPDQASTREIYKIDPWQFGDQPMDPLDLVIRQGDWVQSTCHWDNPGPTPVIFGEGSDDEMCFAVLFYYPADEQEICVDP